MWLSRHPALKLECDYLLECHSVGAVWGRDRHARKCHGRVPGPTLERSVQASGMELDLSGLKEGFKPPAPFNLDELDPAGLLPERPYTKDELGTYLQHCRRKASRENPKLIRRSGVRRAVVVHHAAHPAPRRAIESASSPERHGSPALGQTGGVIISEAPEPAEP